MKAYIAVVSYVGGHDDGRQSWLINFCVVIRINANFFAAQVKRIAAMLHGLEFVVRAEVGEPPQPRIDDVGEALLLRYLKRKFVDAIVAMGKT